MPTPRRLTPGDPLPTSGPRRACAARGPAPLPSPRHAALGAEAAPRRHARVSHNPVRGLGVSALAGRQTNAPPRSSQNCAAKRKCTRPARRACRRARRAEVGVPVGAQRIGTGLRAGAQARAMRCLWGAGRRRKRRGRSGTALGCRHEPPLMRGCGASSGEGLRIRRGCAAAWRPRRLNVEGPGAGAAGLPGGSHGTQRNGARARAAHPHRGSGQRAGGWAPSRHGVHRTSQWTGNAGAEKPRRGNFPREWNLRPRTNRKAHRGHQAKPDLSLQSCGGPLHVSPK